MGNDVETFQEANILLFGGHVLSQSKSKLAKVVQTLTDGPNADWIRETVAGLPSYWSKLSNTIPEVGANIPGKSLLEDLSSWLQRPHDSFHTTQDENLSNLITGPLLVAIQLDQYWRYLELARHQNGLPLDVDLQAALVAQRKDKQSPDGSEVEILGFCVGLLGALAVSSSSNRRDFEKFGSVAMRLSMLIGALIDAREVWDQGLGKGKSVSYAIAWRGAKQHGDLTRIVTSLFPEAYISVLFDEARATVTTSERTAPSLVRQLRAAGLTVAEIGIEGHIHSPGPDRKRHTNALIEMCRGDSALQFADASMLALPTYDNHGDGIPISSDRGDMTEMVLTSILALQCNWYGTLSKILADKNDAVIVAFGLDRCISPTLQRRLGSRQQHFEDIQRRNFPNIMSKSKPLLDQQQTRPQQQPHDTQQQQRENSPESGSTIQDSRTTLETAMDIPRSADAAASETDYNFIDQDSIAVVGMSIKVAGADDLDEFVDMLKEGKSQHELITRDRLQHVYLHREDIGADPNRKYYANFVRDADAFDHKFFMRSPRESQAIDPQSRLCLEGAYQAVEQSGYFSEPTISNDTRDKLHVGVYLGNCGVDYEHNIACNPPSAFTATGGLKSFIVGRLSHYFGWTGPSMSFDTACSSSTVAIHTACRNLLSGECSAALCGGVNIITNMLWMQNLAASSFISPTGQCKPFDEDADGYCRAEGMAFVFLKKLSDAVADGNPVLATIPATVVYQNLNCTPLFVPNSPSLSHLFKDVMKSAKVEANDISLVETHGTGTPVGDPAEYESIRLALGGPVRKRPLPIGSVKGHIGHTEGASGIIALVKVIMMMRHGFIPAQASFRKLNHQIQVQSDDNIEIVTSLRPWTEERKIALINNYGACGSNASMVIAQPPLRFSGRQNTTKSTIWPRPPIRITGLDARSISAYSNKLTSWLQLLAQRGEEEPTIADLSYAMARQSNQALPQGMFFSCGSLSELKERLVQAASAKKENAAAIGIMPVGTERPVILCFGGQVSTFIGLDRKVYDSVALLRSHLEHCDAVMISAGLESIFPDIFTREPVKDTVKLQTMLFALQYSCAKIWMDCGLEGKISAVIGHSFGEITALCVAEVLSLDDTVKLVAGRAKLVRGAWGPDSGAMMAVEGDGMVVQDLIREINRISDGSASVATYNGPRSFTLAGSTKAIEAAAEILAGSDSFKGIKSKRLSVSNAFHSGLVDGLIDGLGRIGKELTFLEPAIPVEHATQDRFTSKLDWSFVPSHMRNPVHFNEALHRLSEQYPKALFLEAGSSSTITLMAQRALVQNTNSHQFQAMSISNTHNTSASLESLTDATVALWKSGLRVSFWPHHPKQARDYTQLLLPPYQFDKSGRHWLEMKSPTEAINKAAEAIVAARGLAVQAASTGIQPQEHPLDMYSFVAYQDKKKRRPRFRINKSSERYNHYFSGHVIAQTAPICPATLQSDIAIEALFNIHPEWKKTGHSAVLHDLVNHSPVCANPSRVLYLDFDAQDESMKQWGVKIFSSSDGDGKKDVQLHVEARLHFRSPTDPDFIQEFARYERFVSHSRCKALLKLGLDHEQDDQTVDVLQGRNVYRAFRDIVDYPELYRGVRTVVGGRNESAGIVSKRHQGESWLDVAMSDSFSQVGGMWVNLMTDIPPGDIYIATGCEMSMRSPKVQIATNGKEQGPSLWHVYAQHSPKSDKEYTTDVFVFDASTGSMHEAMLGVQYARVSKKSMSKMLTRLTTDSSVLRNMTQPPEFPPYALPAQEGGAGVAPAPSITNSPPEGKAVRPSKKKNDKKGKYPKRRPDLTNEVHELVANVAGIDPGDFSLDTEMADLGIDSLMGMELGREVEIVFKCTLDQAEQMEATTLRQLVVCVSNALDRIEGKGSEEDDDDGSGESDEDNMWDSHSGSSFSTPDEDGSLTSSGKPEMIIAGAVDGAKPTSVVTSNLTLSKSDILGCFGEVKMMTDRLIRMHHLDTIHKVEIAGSNRLCTALVVEAMEKLGMSLRNAIPGQLLDRVPFLPQHGRLMEWVYQFLERDARLIDIDAFTGQLTRTYVAVPTKPSQDILQELINTQPGFSVPNRITYYAGKSLAEVLSGKTDGVRVIFGTPEGRELVQAMYCEHSFNRMNYVQMRDVVSGLVHRVKYAQPGETLKVLEMGAGTGGTTFVLAPFLASIAHEIPVEYTFTDLSPSMVANARRTFGNRYTFMKFAVHDIEKPPSDEHKGQHIIIASNAVHATHNLVTSGYNIRQALRSDGFMMIAEMTEVVPFVDLVFGLLEGWWLFDDGRKHAVVPAEHWERELHAAGFGHVDWTDGSLPENDFQKVIIALASGQPEARLPKALPTPIAAAGPGSLDVGDLVKREAEAESFVKKYSQGWVTPELEDASRSQSVYATPTNAATVLVTGATGSLGAHLVQAFAHHPNVVTVVCINRRSSMPIEQRQEDAFSSRGIQLSPTSRAKLRILETDTSAANLGLSSDEYNWLVENGTHIVHNAWPMSGTRPIQAFETQIQVLRNLLDLARCMGTRGSSNSRVRIGFQFVSSIGVVGYAGENRVQEQRVPMKAVMPGGYTEAKWACERLLDETLHRYPKIFRPMVTRPGQIAGSTKSGVWNPVEHFAFLVKSAQTLRVWPDLEGILQWLPVDNCAEVMVDLFKIGDENSAPDAHAVYHIDNPVGQPWKEMSPVLAAALNIPPDGIIPFTNWIKRVRRSPLSPETENPAARLIDFIEFHFPRMSCGGLILDTKQAQQHSKTMARQGPVSAEIARSYVAAWKKMGYLNP